MKRRKRWTVFEKLKIVEKSKRSSVTICLIVKENGITPSQLYLWRRLEREGKLKVFKEEDEVILQKVCTVPGTHIIFNGCQA